MRWRNPILIAALLTLGACDWLTGSVKPPLPGERTPVLTVDRKLEPDERLRETAVKLPDAADVQQWPQPQGRPGTTMANVLVDGFKYTWRTSIGEGNSRSGRVTGAPVVADGRLFAVDASSRLAAIDVSGGGRLWTFNGEPDDDRSGGGSGGGAAVDGDKVYFATGYGQLIALEAKTGKELWRYQMGAPARSGPAVTNGRVFVATIDNQTHAVDAVTGKRIWQHTGISESAGFVGAASPVVDGTTVLVGYSSGELFALRAESGRVLWSDTLSGVIRTGQVSGMADIRGRPAIDKGMAFVSTQSGRTVAIDMRSGARVWEQEIGSLGQPWVAGDYVFVMGVDGEVACLLRRDGRAVWVTPLGGFTDVKRKRGRIVWTGPVVASGQVFVVNNQGEAVLLDAAKGTVVSRISLPGSAEIAPIAANRTIFVLTDDGDIAAVR
ncbi:MAG: PQQ-binding-like beta-propeller repeat protein [Proteobacteria bacterium]|nr:PQQ-binding-like beta-propeller repeat protein [Pseudomonadota bacterium]